MKLNEFTDYSLRILIYVALKRPEERSTIDEMCAAYNLPRNHVMKIVRRLAELHFLENTRGRGGGVRLQVPPDQINLADVVRRCENSFALAECQREVQKTHCCIQRNCVLKSALNDALDAFFAVLADYTIADLVAPQSALRRALDLQPAGGPGR